MTSVYPLLAQASRDPLPPADVAEIFEDVKDMGVLIGKGGVYGQVGRRGPIGHLSKQNTEKIHPFAHQFILCCNSSSLSAFFSLLN